MFEFICVYALLSLAYLLWSTTVATTKKTVVWLKIVLKVMPIVSLQCYVLKQLSLGGDTSSVAGYDRVAPFGILVAIVSLILYLYLLPKIKTFLALPAAFYCCLIGCMLWRALVRFQVHGDLIGVLGAVVYYISDSLLAVNKFRHRIFYADQLIMTTYYTAQLCITVSVMNSL